MQLSSLFSSSSIYSTSSLSSTTSTTSVSETDNSQASTSSNFDTVSFSLADSGVVSAHRSTGESLMDMSTDDFRDHLQDIVDEMTANGIDTSSYDVSSLSDEDLESLKTSMHEAGGKGKNGPPPPPKGYEMGASMTASTSSSDDLTQMLLDALTQTDEDEEENFYQMSQDLLQALQSDYTIDETGDLASFIAANM